MTITVGASDKDQQSFPLSLEHLAVVSGYFEKAFQGQFREASEKIIALDDVDPLIFGIFNEWFMSRKLLNTDGKPYQYLENDKDGAKDKNEPLLFEELLDVYIFADKYDVPQLRRDTINAWIDYQADCPILVPSRLITKAYIRVPSTSKLRKFLVESFAWSHPRWERDDKAEAMEILPKEFILDMMITYSRLGKARPVMASPFVNRCRYHEA